MEEKKNKKKKKKMSAWYQFPIKEGEIWHYYDSNLKGDSMISVCDIRHDYPTYCKKAEMVYCDPPWNKALTNYFINKACKENKIKDYADFYMSLFERINETNAQVCYLEIGKQYVDVFEFEMGKLFPIVDVWEITYYKERKAYLLRGAYDLCKKDFSGLDDSMTPYHAIGYEILSPIVDMCMGRGLTALACYNQCKCFYGVDINKNSLAHAISKLNKEGAKFKVS